MSEIRDHYVQILGARYSAMLGDFDAAVEREMELFRAAGLEAGEQRRALDLGCGSGLHSIALARLGYMVIAVDFVPELLNELDERATGLPIQSRVGDLREPAALAGAPFDCIVCMGDTLAHLESPSEIRALLEDCGEALNPTGRMVLGFRDQSRALEGVDRILPVVQENDRIWTCFLEYSEHHIRVHDIVHERLNDGSWEFVKGSYDKLRLSPDGVTALAESAGFRVFPRAAGRGFVALTLAK